MDSRTRYLYKIHFAEVYAGCCTVATAEIDESDPPIENRWLAAQCGSA